MADRNDEVRAVLQELARLTALHEQDVQSFRVRAYESAAASLEAFMGDLSTMTEKELVALRGVGKSTAKKIREYFDTGRVTKLESLREKFPPEILELTRVPGLGPRGLARLRDHLGVGSVADLRRAIEEKQLRNVPGFGPRSEVKMARSLDRMGMTGKERRLPIAEAMSIARRLIGGLDASPAVLRVEYAGSLRRFRETIGDIDILVASTDPEAAAAAFLALPDVREVLAGGLSKCSVLASRGVQVDYRCVPPHQWGAAMLYFTGSKAHNIRLRQRAIARGWLLNEYGLFDQANESLLCSETEAQIYDRLELPFIPPPMREDTGELEAALAGELPAAISTHDVNGDLHAHSTLSGDGRSGMADMLQAACDRGYGYFAVTDHAEDLPFLGVGKTDLLRQREQLCGLRERWPDMALLHGIELNIGPEGGLDYDQDFRMSFDWCIAAVHSHFDLDPVAQTRRIITAMANPAVNVIGHLTGRRIGRRPGIELDIGAILEAAQLTGCALEINSALPRLDLSADILRRARDLDVKLVMSTDAHHCRELDRMEWGVRQAARGWVGQEQIANTWSRDRFLSWIQGQRRRPSVDLGG